MKYSEFKRWLEQQGVTFNAGKGECRCSTLFITCFYYHEEHEDNEGKRMQRMGTRNNRSTRIKQIA